MSLNSTAVGAAFEYPPPSIVQNAFCLSGGKRFELGGDGKIVANITVIRAHSDRLTFQYEDDAGRPTGMPRSMPTNEFRALILRELEARTA